jgi:hypothetical protein
MAQGTTAFPTALDTARENPSNMDSSEAAILAMQAQMGITYAIAADGALPTGSATVILTKAGVSAMTLAAPSADGVVLRVMSFSANAHTITTSDLIHDGTTGTHDTATFAAFQGASITLVGWSGKWLVAANNAVTITT